jgi:WD40 repeat protein
VRLWDTASAKQTAKLSGHQARVWSVCFSADGARLASASDDQTVRLWDTASAKQTAKFEGHQGRVQSVCFSADGARLASASDDQTVRLWDVESGRLLAVLVAFSEGWLAHTPEGRYKMGGETVGQFWQTIGLCRFEPGELDPYVEEIVRVGDEEPLG